jgi:hypothetical protein
MLCHRCRAPASCRVARRVTACPATSAATGGCHAGTAAQASVGSLPARRLLRDLRRQVETGMVLQMRHDLISEAWSLYIQLYVFECSPMMHNLLAEANAKLC